MKDMMFRGKRLDNKKWITESETYIHDGDGIWLADETTDVVKVDPATVGLYTEYKDVTGRRICDNDLVEWENLMGAKMRSVIVFDGRAFVFADEDEYRSGKFEGGLWACKCRIIGNIHDNPELLKGSDDDE